MPYYDLPPTSDEVRLSEMALPRLALGNQLLRERMGAGYLDRMPYLDQSDDLAERADLPNDAMRWRLPTYHRPRDLEPEEPRGFWERAASDIGPIHGDVDLSGGRGGQGGLAALVALSSLAANYMMGRANRQMGERVERNKEREAEASFYNEAEQRMAVERERARLQRLRGGARATRERQAGYRVRIPGAGDWPETSGLAQDYVRQQLERRGVLERPERERATPSSGPFDTNAVRRAEEQLRAAESGFRANYFRKKYPGDQVYSMMVSTPLTPEGRAEMENDPTWQRAKFDYDVEDAIQQANAATTDAALDNLEHFLTTTRQGVDRDPRVVRAVNEAITRVQKR